MLDRDDRYPYVPGAYGLPLESISPDDEEITGGSRAKFNCMIWPGEILITPQDKSPFILQAYVDVGHILGLNLSTKDLQSGQRHPDLFAAKFVGFALRHFAKNGLCIDVFRSKWYEGDNYSAYLSARRRRRTPIEAAQETWTGQIMMQYGFVIVKAVNIRENHFDECIKFDFYRARV